jgi:hypothetical protein
LVDEHVTDDLLRFLAKLGIKSAQRLIFPYVSPLTPEMFAFAQHAKLIQQSFGMPDQIMMSPEAYKAYLSLKKDDK